MRCARRRYNLGTVADSEAKSEIEDPSSQPDTSRVSRDEDEPMLYCPVCSKRLTSRKCKLFCETCGYYMSCADYY